MVGFSKQNYFKMPRLFLFLLTMHVWFIKSSSSSRIFIFCLGNSICYYYIYCDLFRIATVSFLGIEIDNYYCIYVTKIKSQQNHGWQ